MHRNFYFFLKVFFFFFSFFSKKIHLAIFDFLLKVKIPMHCFFVLCIVFFFLSLKIHSFFVFEGFSILSISSKSPQYIFHLARILRYPQKHKIYFFFTFNKKKQCIEQKNNAQKFSLFYKSPFFFCCIFKSVHFSTFQYIFADFEVPPKTKNHQIFYDRN